MYSAKVMDHFEHPRNVGEIEDASGVGTVATAAPHPNVLNFTSLMIWFSSMSR